MLTLEYVHPNFVHQVWPKVEGYLRVAEVRSGQDDYNVDQLRGLVVAGTNILFVVTRNGEFKGALTLTFEDYPSARVAFVTAVGGKGIANEAVWEQLCNWCRNAGATKIRGLTHESAVRLWKMKLGMEPKLRLMEKDL